MNIGTVQSCKIEWENDDCLPHTCLEICVCFEFRVYVLIYSHVHMEKEGI